MTQLLPLPTIEADPGRVPAVGGHSDLQLHTGGDDYWSVGRKHDLCKIQQRPIIRHLNERLWGQMGVTMTAGTLGWIMLAPAATA